MRYAICTLLIVATCLTIVGYPTAIASEASPKTSPIEPGAHLIVFNLGADGVERTVLVDPVVVSVGGHPFLKGVVTDKFPIVTVVSPGTTAMIPVSGVGYMQLLKQTQAAKTSLTE